MENKIILESQKSKYSVNQEENLAIDFSSKSRLLPYNDITTKLSLNELYNAERDACEKYRLIFTVNPICTNVLFNMRTEFVKDEGSDNCQVLLGSTEIKTGTTGFSAVNTTNVDWKQAIRDTEYSHPNEWSDGKPLVYHCGLDILNNHMLRQDDFLTVSKVGEHPTVFNTIADYIRNWDGTTREEVTGIDTGTTQPVHQYQYDNILTMYSAFVNRVKEENGWYGFKNRANIDIPNATLNGVSITLNKVMNNNKACEFIDFYPDRSLYSFMPKINRYKHRVENNWDYCLTYPYAKDFDKLQSVVQSGITASLTIDGGKCAIRIIDATVYNTMSGFECIRMKTMFKHTLQSKDYITLFYQSGTTLVKRPLRIKVYTVGNLEGQEKDRYFSIKLSDIADKFARGTATTCEDKVVFRGTDLKPTTNIAQFFYKKNVDGYDCQYYFRKFKKLTYDNKAPKSEINKLAFGENIYGDRVAQIIYTDSIDVNGLVDHNNRPLTELYLTVIKRNKGYKEWYNNNNFTADTIEFSHCFGKITSGIDMPTDDACTQYNVRRLHNIDLTAINSLYTAATKSIYGKVLNTKIEPLESEITIDCNEFYGDIAEFDSANMKETVIEHVYYRFNTAQRESVNSGYCDILYDRLDYDDYDRDINTSHLDGFKITSGWINTIKDSSLSEGHTTLDYLFAGNLQPEGYYYNPHFKVQIRQISDELTKVSGRTLNYGYVQVNTDISGNTYAIAQLTSRYTLIKNAIVALYNYDTKKIMWGRIDSFEDNDAGVSVKILLPEEATLMQSTLYHSFANRKMYLVLTDNTVASYAEYRTDSHTFVWREIMEMSNLTTEDELYDMPFTNGHHYINKNINLFLKRQDPRNEYFLLSPEEASGAYNPLKNYKVWGWDTTDISASEYNDGNNALCL